MRARSILIDQYRVPVGKRCLELPAGLVGDEDPNATVEETAIKELEEETGFTAERIERLGEFHSSPGMLTESFTLVRAHGVRKVGDGGGTEDEDINVHLVAREDMPEFVAAQARGGDGHRHQGSVVRQNLNCSCQPAVHWLAGIGRSSKSRLPRSGSSAMRSAGQINFEG